MSINDTASDYFSTPAIAGLFQQVKHLCLFGADVLVVEGAVGSGKTALALALSKELSSIPSVEVPINIDLITIPSGCDAPSAIINFTDALGISSSGQSVGENLTHLRSYVQNLLREKRLSVLLIDGSESIVDEALGALLSVLHSEREDAFGLRYIFFSEPGFVQRVDALGLIDLSVYDFQVPEFSSAELARFLAHKVPDFDDLLERERLPSVNGIWNKVAGNPGLALRFVEKHLSAANKSNLVSDIRKIPVLHIVVLAALVALLVLVALYRSEEKPQAELESKRDVRVLTPESAISVGPAEAEPSIILSQESAVASPEGDAETSTNLQITAEVVSDDGERVPGGPNGASTAVDIVIDAAEPEVVEENSDVEPAVESILSAPPPSPTPSPQKIKDALTSDEHFLLGLDDSAYMLQLVAASQRNTLDGYVKAQPNNDSLYIYRRRNGDKREWYIVVLGPFSGKVESQKAIQTLPSVQQKAGPWPKSIQSIKQDIDDFRQ